MPFKSEAQRRLFYSAAAGRARNGPSPAVAKKFIADSSDQKGSLPERLGALAAKRKNRFSRKGSY